MTRRLIVWLVVLCLATGFGWAAGQSEGTEGKADWPEITVMDFYEFCPDATPETLAFKWWGEAVEAVIVPIHIPRQDFDIKFSTMLASRDFPDIMRVLGDKNADMHLQYGPEGWFVNVTEQIAKGNMPNLAKVAATLTGQVFLLAPDGNSYMTPKLAPWGQVSPNIGFSLRAELMEKAGWDISPENLAKETETVDGLLDACRAVYRGFNKDRETPVPVIQNRGVRGLLGGWVVAPVTKAFNTYLRIWYNAKNRFEFGPLSENFKISLQFLNALNTEGILHPEWMTMEEDVQGKLSWAQGEMGIWLLDARPGVFEGWGATLPFPGTITYPVKPPIINGERAKWRVGGLIKDSYVMNANSENVAKVVEAQDWAYGEKGAETLIYGREGVTFERDSSFPFGRAWLMKGMGWYTTVELPDDAPTARADGFREGVNRMIPPSDWGLHPWASYAHPDYTADRIKEMAAQEAYGNEWEADGLKINEPLPIFNFTDAENDEKAQIEAALHTYVDEELVKFIQGQNSFDEWDGFVKKQKELGADRLEQIYNAALDRYLKSTK